LHTGQPERLFPEVDPHGHGAQVASTGGSVVQTLHTGQPERLLPEVDPHGHGAQVGSAVLDEVMVSFKSLSLTLAEHSTVPLPIIIQFCPTALSTNTN
jgi:hypothetical protein